MVNFGPLRAEIVSLVWGAPANFNGFRVLVSLLQRRRSTEANQTLHDVWPSPGLVLYIFGSSCLVTEFCQVQHSLCVSYFDSVTARSERQPNFAALNRGRHLYSAGRPSRWALVHILVLWCLLKCSTFVRTGLPFSKMAAIAILDSLNGVFQHWTMPRWILPEVVMRVRHMV